jgi:hypothetical protein
VYRALVIKYLPLAGVALTLLGAQCESANPLYRSCPGSVAQSLYYRSSGDCGAVGVMRVTLSTAGSCALTVDEQTIVGLPSVGSFNDLSSATGYDLAKGNWNLDDPSQGIMNIGTFLSCTGGVANSAGLINLTCEQEVCAVGDSDDVQCSTGVSCSAHLAPISAAEGEAALNPDAGAAPVDATTGKGD